MMKRKEEIFSVVFDTLFIMILCFATLLTTMVLQGGVIVGGEAGLKYIIKWPSFIMTLGGLLIYLLYVLKESDKELKKMIEYTYNEDVKKAN